ncbi:MAG: M20/M25/M40 family metallo-hydrolase [Candidatus Brockarchaeota archaeon]|nr:M20/M25/M40 family metallo-hydrolase [Candidatus Brockarchaeota archaeon]
MMDRAGVYRQMEKDFEKHVENLLRFVRQPSVSPQNIGVRDAAELLREMAGGAGFRNTRLVETSGNPVVYGELDVGAPVTMLVYTMYDTMPADEPGWTVDPFAGEIRRVEPFGETLIARGAVNTKGPLIAFLNTVKAIVESGQEPPVNLVFAAEGEEELGSKNLPEFIRKCESQLKKADVLFFPGASQNSKGKAIVTLGVKGIVYFELELDGKHWGRGPTEFGIHGSNKAWVDSPAWRMVKALSTMVDETGNRVLVEGFYDDVRVPSEEDEALLSRLAETFDEQEVKERMRVERFIEDLHGVEALRKYLFTPTLNIDGLWSGYTGPGSKTLLPHRITVKMDVRLVPQMQVEKTMSLIRSHFDKHGFSEIRIRRLEEGYGWARMSVNSPYTKALLRAFEEFNVEIEIWPTIAGSAPFSMFAAPPLGLPFMVGGMGHGGLAHSPNEYLVIGEGGPTGGLLTMEKSFAAILDNVSTLKNF